MINSRSRQLVHEINAEEDIYGEFLHLYTDLRGHSQRFFYKNVNK
jgi:hypothetical protein